MSNISRSRREEWSGPAHQQPASSLREEMNTLFDSFLNPHLVARERSIGWMPAMDVAETPTAVTIKIEVPGMKPEQVDIRLAANVLTVTGEKKEEIREDIKSWHRIERSHGAFSRSVVLPEGVDGEKVSATYDDGVLTIEVPKSEAAKPRQIKVTTKG